MITGMHVLVYFESSWCWCKGMPCTTTEKPQPLWANSAKYKHWNHISCLCSKYLVIIAMAFLRYSVFLFCYRANWVCINGTKYQVPFAIIIGTDDEDLQFGSVVNVYIHEGSVLFEFIKMITHQFYHHYHAYCLSLPSATNMHNYVIYHNELPDFHPQLQCQKTLTINMLYFELMFIYVMISWCNWSVYESTCFKQLLFCYSGRS